MFIYTNIVIKCNSVAISVFMIDIFLIKNLKKTPFRKEVLAIFRKHDNAIPLSTIEDELVDFNRITLYRTIKFFIEKGIIHKISLSDNTPNYAICKEECNTKAHQHQHIHFKCSKCKIISCVEIDHFPEINLPEYAVHNLEIQATGFCENCNSEKKI